MKQRIEWIDTAKGICILLVVLHHTSNFLHVGYPCASDFTAFRMPLYFMLSGLFFKEYSGFIDFSIRKLNKLIIPYLFFFVTGGAILPILLFKLFGFRVWSYKDYGFEVLGFVFGEKVISNPSIWFLVCLFEVNLLFYMIRYISIRMPKSNVICLILSLLSGGIGLLWSHLQIDIPYFIDSAFAVVPFFFVGWYLRNYTSFLTFSYNKRNFTISLMFVLLTFFVIHFYRFGFCGIGGNIYGNLYGIIQLYPYGICGTLSVLLIAKKLGTIPLVSYVGRYSIIVLCIHAYLIQFAGLVLAKIMTGGIILLISTFVITVLLCAMLIPSFKKYLPYFVAQKDIIKYNS